MNWHRRPGAGGRTTASLSCSGNTCKMLTMTRDRSITSLSPPFSQVPGACKEPAAPAPAPAPPQPAAAAPAAATASTGGGGAIVRDVDISAYLAAGDGAFAAAPPARVLSPQVQEHADRSDEISTLTGNYLCRGYCMLATACEHCNTVLLRDRSGKEICVAQEIPGACPGEAQPAPAPAPVAAQASTSAPTYPTSRNVSAPFTVPTAGDSAGESTDSHDDESDPDSEEEEVVARRRNELLRNAQSRAAQELQRRQEMMYGSGAQQPAAAEFGRAPAAGGLFGAPPAATGLFGAPPAATGGGLFGATAAAGNAFGAFGQAAVGGGAVDVRDSVLNAVQALSSELNASSQMLQAGGNTLETRMQAVQLMTAVGTAMKCLLTVPLPDRPRAGLPAFGGGMFGAHQPAATGFGGAAPAAGGLFGAQPAVGGLFGAAPAAGGLFGAQQPAAGGFGAAPPRFAVPDPTGDGGFGRASATAPTGLFD